MARFGQDLTDYVTIPVTFTRPLFAQLTHKPFHAPRKFHKWLNNCKIKTVSLEESLEQLQLSETSSKSTSSSLLVRFFPIILYILLHIILIQRKKTHTNVVYRRSSTACDLGCRITCGFEAAYQNRYEFFYVI